eukprot:14139217-Alexandrium_andersonii.AAC.1
MAMGRAGYRHGVSAPPVRRCDVDVRRPLMLVRERLAKYQLLVAASAPRPLAQALQAELAPFELHSAP